MKVSKWVWLTAAAIGLSSGAAQAQQFAQQLAQPYVQPGAYPHSVNPHGPAQPHGAHPGYAGPVETTVPLQASRQVGPGVGECDCGEVVCGCETADVPVVTSDCGCDASCDGGCDGSCGARQFRRAPFSHGSNGGDPFSLFGRHGGISAGGWVQLGYHNRALPMFNRHPHNYNLHQAWLFAEKKIDARHGFDIGGRIDYVYGVDGPDTQAFGTEPRGWDNSWDHGIYGHALPQAYLEAGYGNLSVKAGHFFGPLGMEVIPAPGNFFYSHTYTRYHSAPFTHTGALANYRIGDDASVFGGYTAGWDSGFDDNGDNYLGGFTSKVNDFVTFTYATAIGRFNEERFHNVAERGYMHSIVLNTTLTKKLQYIFHSDFLDTEDATGADARETFDISQYLIYQLNDRWAGGARFEWYNQEGVFPRHEETPGPSPQRTGAESNFYALTLGVNYKPHSNVLIRPEVRWDWDEDEVAELDGGERQTTFGVDTIFLF